MQIDVWSDVVCPFCYIGKAALDRAIAQTGAQVTVVHRAFRLQPGEKPVPVSDMLARKYGLTGAAAQASQQRVIDMAAQLGLEFHLDGTLIGDTVDAHKLLALAGEKGVQRPLLERLYSAYFTKRLPIFDRETLLSLGEESGLKRADMDAALASPAIEARVAADQQQAQGYGIRGVPFFVFDGKYAVSGAQPVEAFVQALQTSGAISDGAACDVNGC